MSNELIIPNDLTIEIFQKEGALENLIADVRKKVANYKGDISTPAGRKAIASFAYKVTRSKTAINEIGEELLKSMKAEVSIFDGLRQDVCRQFDIMRDTVRKPLTDWEVSEAARIKEHEDAIKRINQQADAIARNWKDVPLDVIQSALQRLLEEDSARNWEEYAAIANGNITSAESRIKNAIVLREAYMTEQAELAQLRKEKAEREAEAAQQQTKLITHASMPSAPALMDVGGGENTDRNAALPLITTSEQVFINTSPTTCATSKITIDSNEYFTLRKAAIILDLLKDDGFSKTAIFKHMEWVFEERFAADLKNEIYGA